MSWLEEWQQQWADAGVSRNLSPAEDFPVWQRRVTLYNAFTRERGAEVFTYEFLRLYPTSL